MPGYRLGMEAFANQHVVVTGSTGGLGGAVVLALLEQGATVHLPMIEDAVPAQVVWKGRERVVPRAGIPLDSEPAVVDYFASLPPLWASVHLVGGFAMSGVVETSLDALTKMHALNVVPTFLCSREAVRSMQRGGVGGRIVNVAAKPVLAPSAGMLAYAASKAAVASITATLGAELAAEGIFANAIVPSIIDTPLNRKAMPDADFATWPKPAEIAETVVHLASRRNLLTTGTLVPVYGKAG